ncbi:hypothetical protein C8J57DRAFT_1647524 [Mycena rebaudengoi]|nr:hypothetical protein C8J57DRAFT_1647524 [Mycena rebaudengoi]
MQFKLHISAILLAFAMGAASAAIAADSSFSSKRSVWNDCFNLGYEDGEASGCNAASGNNKRELVELALTCPGGTALGDAFNTGFNLGFNDGFNRCF